MTKANIEIRPLEQGELTQFWQLAFSNPHAEWTRWNGPYFHDVLPSQDVFTQEIAQEAWLNNDLRWVITYNNELVGSLSAYYEDGALKRWLDVGIVIYEESMWGQHIGQEALNM